MENKINKIIFLIGTVLFGIVILVDIQQSKITEDRLFPGIIGDMILRDNETGVNFINKMTTYDDFRGNVLDGYKANYSGKNGSMIIFMAQLKDNFSANMSFNDMVSRIIVQNNNSIGNLSLENNTIIKLPVKNPIIYVIQKDKNVMWHYTFIKNNKVFWVGFNNPNIDYQLDVLREAYMKIDKDKNNILE